MLDLFVKVPAGAAAPIKHKPMKVDAINQVADEREQKEASEFLTAANQLLMAGGVSVEDRSKRTETVRPHHDEHFESQLVCDSALSAKSVGDDIELNGETDAGDVEDGETGFDDRSAQVRNIRDPGQPTASEHTEDHRSTLQIMVQVLCDGAWCEFTAQEIRCSR